MENKSRKKWGRKDQDVQLPINAPAVNEEILPQYGEHLLLLQERNRLIKKLKRKDKKQILLERKENGFVLYVNGANADRDGSSAAQPNSSRTRTAGEPSRRYIMNAQDLIQLEAEERQRYDEKKRARTAPSKTPRKTWNVGSVDLTTDRGRKNVKAPDYLTGNYDDDFEPDESSDFNNSSERTSKKVGQKSRNRLHDDSDSDIEIDASACQSSSDSRPSSASKRTSYLKTKAAALRKEEESNRLNLTIADVKKLRLSLEKNVCIKQSLAMEVSSTPVCLSLSSDDEDITEEINLLEDEADSERESPIEEEDADSDEIAEELVPATESVCLDGKKTQIKNPLKPSDTIVLEFDPTVVHRKIERNLSAPRKKDIDLDSTSNTSTSKQQLTPLNRTRSSISPMLSREMELRPVKSSHPLSAHRKNQDNRLDSQQEAVAVMKAMQAENEKAQSFSKESKISPRPKIRPSSGTPQPSSSRLSTPGKNTPVNKVSAVTREGALTDDKMHSIITKVLGMNPKQQRSLMKTLGKLEESSKECRPLPNKPVKATVPVSVMHNNNKQPSQTEIIEVNMEILSNWGSESRVGLTEMQFFDQDGRLIQLDANDISVHGATGCKMDLDVLCNGKTKTTKERYMWVCNFSAKNSVEFVIMLQNPSPHKHFEISTIKLWNYNKSVNQLDIGAKHVRIFVGGELVFDGDVEKGCGNQVFDYCSVISVSGKDKMTASKGYNSSDPSPVNGPDSARSVSRSSQSSASSSGSHPSSARQRRREEKGNGNIRSETRTMTHSISNDLQRSESSPENQEYQDNFKMPEKRSKTPRKTNRLAARLNGRPSETEISTSSEHKISVSQEKASVKSPRRSTDKIQTKSVVDSSLSTSRDSPVRDTHEQDDVSMMQKLKEMKLKESPRKKQIPMWLKADEMTENSGLSGSGASQDSGRSDSRAKSRLHTDSASPRSETGEMLDEITPMQKIEKKRSQWKTNHDNLEEEWGCLNYFNKQQKGRLSIDMGDSDFDEYFKDIEKPTGSSEPAIKEDSWVDEEDGFVIPELPCGKELTINILTTWGDHHYVGLTGVDIFSSSGESVTVKKITAKPLDINELEEYNKDPRVVSNIIDGVNRTRDDVHMWLAPFTPSANHCVFMTFDKPYKISMIRFWNYNKSRIHSYRGAKDVVMMLDGKQIFKGEIARACGGIEGGTETFGDTILFTTDDNILELVSKNDDAYEGDLLSTDEEDAPFERPSTADNDSDERPFTRAAGVSKKPVPTTPRPATSITTYAGDVLVYKARAIELNFIATWGDHYYLGLTGLEIVGKDGEALPLSMKMISAKPRDLHSLPGHERDDRTLDKLIDGTNITNSDEHMWLVPFTEGKDHTVTVTFTQQVMLSGLRIWNYNKSPEDTYRGPRILHVKIDGRQVSPPEGYLIRKGPGNCHFDFAQEINFQTYQAPQNSYPDCLSNDVGFEYEVVQMPCGFIFQLQLFSTWGDQYYVGLNGLEFYDSCFNLIHLIDNNISAYPNSVNVLENVQNDVRTPDKLIDGENSTTDGRHMWLAPILPGIMNRVYVIFDQPTTISMIKIWNYSKTSHRGTKDFALLVDDLLIYNGCLKMVSTGARGILPTCEGSQAYHTVLFTNNKEILKREKSTIISNQPQDQDVQLLNDKKIVTKYSDPKMAQSGKPANQALRPKTSVPLKRK